jgi:hypothetical protein
MTPQEIRKTRLQSDYREMCNIRGPLIDWEVMRGTPPYVEAYRLTVNVRSIIGPGPNYRDRHVIDLEIPPDYPLSPQSAPVANMVTDPGVFHPNWWPHKLWCYGIWELWEGLGQYVLRMIRTLQYDPDITNENSAANHEAADWYVAHKDNGIFPCDRQLLPDPSKSRFEIQLPVKKRFEVRS